MPRLKILNLYHKENDCASIHCLRHHLPNLKISGAIKDVSNVFDYPNDSNDFNDSSDFSDSSNSNEFSDSNESSDSNDSND